MINKIPEKLRIACFVSHHGFGHASRVSAVIEQLSKNFPSFELLIFGKTPDWFWGLNIPPNCTYSLIDQITDIGLVQEGPFAHDLNLTLEQVLQFIKFSDEQLSIPLKAIEEFQPDFILSDISPLGLEVGNRLKISTILLENFTWDWIYRPFVKLEKDFAYVISKLETVYSYANSHIQCTPFCERAQGAFKANPVYRSFSKDKQNVYSSLNITPGKEYVLITTGGISMKHTFFDTSEDIYFVIPGNYQKVHRQKNQIYIPMHFHVPFSELVFCASAVVGKAGYGTISECWGTGTPFIGVFRDAFRESAELKKFCLEKLNFREISLDEFTSGAWTKHLPVLNGNKLVPSDGENGAYQVSNEIIRFLFSEE